MKRLGGGMWQNVTSLPTPLTVSGRSYRVEIEGMQRPDKTWAGRLAFHDGKDVRRTEQETSQPDRKALEYWASGLEMVYLEGAFGRARSADKNAGGS
ncbi:MAG TPA: hypothetical protein VFT12_03550 [Thermoanaerobaculia bacterium]|nr:hypothetical protein [Thermoanaerobaculia bacterium]